MKDQALWLDWCGCTDLAYGQSVTVHDGRRDSREGAAGAEAANETPTGLNPNIIQNSTATPGVIHEYQNLFKTTSTDPATALQEAICVIPTGEAMTITIVYDVETTNPKLASYLSDGTTHGSSIENKITNTVTFGGVAGAGLESNKRYALKLHLGMNSVKFDAEVSDWATNTVNGEGWLPSNVRPITLNHTTMYLGNPTNLIATTDPVGQSVTWTNSDPAVVSLGGVVASTRAGTRAVTTLPGTWSTINVTPLALGDATITASLPSGDKAVCEVHVVPIVLTSPNNTTPNNAINETVGKKATVRLEASLFPATGSPSVTWTASPAGLVTLTPVSGDPTKCDVYGDAVGDVVITAQNGTYPTTATCNMSVTSQPPTVVNPVLTANWTYDTNAHDLIATAGTVTGGTMYYSLDGANWFADYNDAALQKTDAGSYPVYYKVEGSAGYDDIPQTLIGTVLVSKATPTLTFMDYDTTTDTPGTTTLISNSGTIGTGMYTMFHVDNDGPGAVTVTSNNGNTTATFTGSTTGDVKLEGVSVGTSTITVTSAATTNYNSVSKTFAATISDVVDLGLSVKWHVRNLDATSPGDAGGFYSWGATSPATSFPYNAAPYYASGSTHTNYKFSKYNATDGKTILEAEDDAASVNMPGWNSSSKTNTIGWRMPTNLELDELCGIYNVWTTYDGNPGRMFIYHSAGNVDTNMFVPAAGFIGAGGSTFHAVGTEGYLRASVMYPKSPQYYQQVWGLFITSSKCSNEDCTNRQEGINIRAVRP